MISREELRQLASFECRHPDELAISFYFKPSTPQDKSHREEGILAKDLVRKTWASSVKDASGKAVAIK